MKRIFAGIAAAVLAAGTCFALAACERKPLKVKTSLETGWTVENMVLYVPWNTITKKYKYVFGSDADAK